MNKSWLWPLVNPANLRVERILGNTGEDSVPRKIAVAEVVIQKIIFEVIYFVSLALNEIHPSQGTV
jgi:hypothetical protein